MRSCSQTPNDSPLGGRSPLVMCQPLAVRLKNLAADPKAVAAMGSSLPIASCARALAARALASLGLASLVLFAWYQNVEAAVSFTPDVRPTQVQTIQFETVNVSNPTYSFDNGVTVSFGTHFEGQTFLGHNMLAQDSMPTSELTLATGLETRTMFDFGNFNGVVLGGVEGDLLYSTPLAILFDGGVQYVSFDLGHLDDNTDTMIEAYDRDGNSLGQQTGLPGGYNHFEMLDVDGSNGIAGVSIYVPEGGMDWEGFALDNVAFALEEDVIPEPSTIVVWSILGTMGCGMALIRRMLHGRSPDKPLN